MLLLVISMLPTTRFIRWILSGKPLAGLFFARVAFVDKKIFMRFERKMAENRAGSPKRQVLNAILMIIPHILIIWLKTGGETM